MSDMGIFRITVEVENPQRPGERRVLTSVMVDTGAELSWFPSEALESLGIERYERRRFRQASGAIVERWVGLAWVHASGKRASDDVVFGQPGDMAILGARTLEGLNFRVDPIAKELIDAGPVDAALAGHACG